MKYRVVLSVILIPLIAIGFVWLFIQASALLARQAQQPVRVDQSSPEPLTPLTGPIRTPATAVPAPADVSPAPADGLPAPADGLPAPSPTIRMIVGPFNDQQAPDFTLNTLDGQPVKLADYRGKVILVNFWASWCGPCKEEMPLLQTADEQHKADGLVVLGINTTFQDNRQAAEQFVRDTRVKFPILLDESGSVSQDFRVISIPMSFFIDRKGIIRHYQMGAMNAAQIQQYLDDLMR